MAENRGRLLAMFDELSASLTKIKLYINRGLTDSHELAMFLELYNANPWTRTTGKCHSQDMHRTVLTCKFMDLTHYLYVPFNFQLQVKRTSP